MIDKQKEGLWGRIKGKARDSAITGVLGLAGLVGMAGMTSSVSCVGYEGYPNNVGGNSGGCPVKDMAFDPTLPDMVLCNYWADRNGDTVMTPNEIVGFGKHSFRVGETFQVYGLNKSNKTVSAEVQIYAGNVLTSTSGQITVQPGGLIWSERSFSDKHDLEMFSVYLLFDGRTVMIENIKRIKDSGRAP